MTLSIFLPLVCGKAAFSFTKKAAKDVIVSSHMLDSRVSCINSSSCQGKFLKFPSLFNQIFWCLTLLIFTTPYGFLHLLTSEDIKHLGNLLPIFKQLRFSNSPLYIQRHISTHMHKQPIILTIFKGRCNYLNCKMNQQNL